MRHLQKNGHNKIQAYYGFKYKPESKIWFALKTAQNASTANF